MICPDCEGYGMSYAPLRPGDKMSVPQPCETCGGCGIAHCCDGDTMPEPPTDHDRRGDDE